LRLKLRKAQAEAGDIELLFADESEALTHPYLARAWARRGADLRVPAPGQAKKVAMMGSLDYARRKLVVTTSRTKRSADFIAHLQLLDRLYGPKPGAPFKPVVLVLDNGPIHVSKATLAALAERAHWLVVEWLPKYTPELNHIRVPSFILSGAPICSMVSGRWASRCRRLVRALSALPCSMPVPKGVRPGGRRNADRGASKSLP
jgi:hypothetical protein